MFTTARSRGRSRLALVLVLGFAGVEARAACSPTRSRCSPTRSTWCRTGSRSGSLSSPPGWRGGPPPPSARSAGGGRRSSRRSRTALLLVALGLWIVVEAVGQDRRRAERRGRLGARRRPRRARRQRRGPRVLHGAGGGLNMRAAFRHVLADLASSVGVVVAALVILLTGWNVADAIAGLLIGLLVLASSDRDPARVDRDPARGRSRGPRHGRARADDARRSRRRRTSTTSTSGRSPPGFRRSRRTCSSSRGPTATGSAASSSEILSDRFGLTHTTLQVEHAPGLLKLGLTELEPVRLEDKAAIVTGASSGIGAAIVRIAASRRSTRRRRARVASTGSTRTVALELDVTDPASCERFVERAMAELGGLDIVVNSAGLALGRDPFAESTEADEKIVLETNVHGLIRITRLCLPHLRDGGHIVNLGSVAGSPRIRRVALRHLEVRGARVHEGVARGSARAADPDHERRARARRDGFLDGALPRRRGEGARGLRGRGARRRDAAGRCRRLRPLRPRPVHRT